MSNPAFAAIILAAGEGTRLNSATPKVLHEMAGWPLIRHVTEALRPLAPAETVVVIGQGMEAVARAAGPHRRCGARRPPGARSAARESRDRRCRRAVRRRSIAPAGDDRGFARGTPPQAGG